jgi:hypothetical protein
LGGKQLKTRLREIATSKTEDAGLLLAQLRQLQKETIEMLDETMDAVRDAGLEADEVEGPEAAEEDSEELVSKAGWRVTEIKPEDVSQAGTAEEEASAGRSPEDDDEDMLFFD